MEGLVVLIADSNPYTRRLTRMMLTNLGIKSTYESPDGVAALDAIRNVNPDIMIMDWEMPVLDGLSAAREIRALEQALGLPRTRIIALSANALPDHIAEARAAGMDDHLAKPIRPEGLIAMLAASAHAKAA